MNIIDISRTLLTAVEYPGDPKTRHEQVRTIENGGCNLSAVYSCVHTGTHADAPCHFIENGETIEDADATSISAEAATAHSRSRNFFFINQSPLNDLYVHHHFFPQSVFYARLTQIERKASN